MGNQLEDGAARFYFDHGWGAGNCDLLQVGTQPIKGKPVEMSETCDETSWSLGPVEPGAPAFDSGRTFGNQSRQGAVGIGSGQAGGTGDRVSAAGTTGQQDFVHQALGGSKAEMG